MADDNKNQDFIETPDDFIEAMDDNFGGPDDPMADDHIIDVEATPEPLMSENEWVDDYDDEMDAVFDEDDDLAQLVEKPQRNWFNIALFGGVGLVICGVLYTYLPGILGGGNSAPQPQGGVAVQNQNLATIASPEQNALLAQQALGTTDESAATTSLFDDPDLLGDGVTSVERADPEAADNQIFEALGNAPQVSEGEINDIFAALDDLQTTTPSATIIDQQPQQLPEPADQMSDTDEDLLLESMANLNAQEPRSPDAPVDTGIATLADVIQTPLTDNETLPQVVPAQSVAVDNTAISALNDRMDLIMTRIESLADKVENLAESEPVLSAPAQGNDETVARLEKTIQTLEKRMATLADSKPVATKPAPKKSAATAPVKRKSEKAYVPPKKTTQWELRGASPDEAYVAQKGSQSLRTVRVGNSLDGIGRITSIAVESGRWVVRGTSGIITQ